jgi:hypothetical protein
MSNFQIIGGIFSLVAVIFFSILIGGRIKRSNKAKRVEAERKKNTDIQIYMGKKLWGLASDLCYEMNRRVRDGSSSEFILWQIPDNGGRYTLVIEHDHAHGEGRHRDPVVQMDINLFADDEGKRLHILYGPYGPDNYCGTTSGLESLISGARSYIDSHYKNVLSA